MLVNVLGRSIESYVVGQLEDRIVVVKERSSYFERLKLENSKI